MFQQKAQEIGDYILGSTLGSGTTCKVKIAEHKETREQVAVKIIKKSQFEQKPELQKKIKREISIMRLLNHPNILKLKEVYESNRHMYIILEYAEHGELFDYLVAHPNFSPQVAMSFFRQIIYGVEYLHVHAICHRDLKLDNILLDSYNMVKIADFGFARWMKENVAETSCGTPHYAAPEIVKGLRYDGRMADIWSCGVILYCLVAGRLPFDDPSFRVLLAKIKAARYTLPEELPHEIQDLISRILVVDPQKRITIEEIKRHPAFSIGLPPHYIMPTPLMIPDILEPIDPSKIDSGILSILNHVGYEKEEDAIADLSSDKHSMAKVFFQMLNNTFSLENLPWESDVTEHNLPILDTISQDVFQFSPDLVLMPGNEPKNPSPSHNKNLTVSISGDLQNTEEPPEFRKKKFHGVSSPYSYSLAYKSSWGSIEPKIDESQLDLTKPNETETFQHLTPPIENVFETVQQLLIQLGYEFFQIDELTIYSRRPDVKLYVTFHAAFTHEDCISLTVNKWNTGLDEAFSQLISQLTASLVGTPLNSLDAFDFYQNDSNSPDQPKSQDIDKWDEY